MDAIKEWSVGGSLGGVKYGNICYDNGDVYVYSGSAGTEAPGGRNWIRMTAFSKW